LVLSELFQIEVKAYREIVVEIAQLGVIGDHSAHDVTFMNCRRRTSKVRIF
jgi:hypothetical protein